MGTRADFYVGRGATAEWLGSIAWDGYPEGVFRTPAQRGPWEETEWREFVASMLAQRDDGTTPSQGWPWPWEDSGTTDYAYALEAGVLYVSCFGGPWHRLGDKPPERSKTDAKVAFPNMEARQRVAMGARSGLIVLSVPRDE